MRTLWAEDGEKIEIRYENGELVELTFYNKDGSIKEPININTLIERKDVYYDIVTNKPYWGPIFYLYDDGKKEAEGTLIDGIGYWLLTMWHRNGQKAALLYFVGDYDTSCIKSWDEDGNEKECWKDY